MRKLMALVAVAALASPALAKVVPVSTDAYSSPAGFSGNRAGVYSTGFEPGAGFVPGQVFGGNGVAPEGPWQANTGLAGANNTLSPVISTLNPAGGVQHLRHKDAAQTTNAARLGFSPTFGPVLGTSSVSFDVALSADNEIEIGGGADYQVIIQSPNAGNGSITARIGFSYYYGQIYVLGTGGSGLYADLDYYDTPNRIPDSGYHNFRLEITPGTNNIDYFLDNVLIYSDTIVNALPEIADPNPGAVGQIVTFDDQWQESSLLGAAGDTGDFDNFSVTPEPATIGLLMLGATVLIRRRR